MTLEQIAKSVSQFFNLTVDDMLSAKKDDRVAIPRHIWRVISNIEFRYNPTDIAKFEYMYNGKEYAEQSRSAVYASVKSIVADRYYEQEYNSALNFIRQQRPESPVVVNEVISQKGITRVTNEAFDERFYGFNERTNTRTGNNWFPSWHFLYHTAAPQNSFLVDYYKNKGWFADFEFHRAEVMGSYVHNRIEEMGKHGIDTTRGQIYRAFPNPKEARRIEECLLSWLNFIDEEEPEILSFEQMLIADDWAGTVDLRAKLKSDDYKIIRTIDFKTSKMVYDSHKSQVESYRRWLKDDLACVMVLGNSTKKRYTMTEIKPKEQDFVYKDFLNIKEVAYYRLEKSGRLQPHESDMPEVFSLKNRKFKIL